MFVRGIDEPVEYKREDFTFYKGIVVKNDDPQKLYRVKIYIPEISNQPLNDWLDTYKKFSIRFPGKNNKNDSWNDTKIFESIADYLPWAEPCFPLMGEGSPGRYNSPNEIATLTDGNYFDGFETNNTNSDAPTSEKGSFSPAWFYENEDLLFNDAFSEPVKLLTGNNNPYSYIGRPSKHVNKAKGMFCVPNIGTKVWVFHNNGDTNYPVYFGVRHDFREIGLINNLDQVDSKDQSLDYPGVFENSKSKQV